MKPRIHTHWKTNLATALLGIVSIVATTTRAGDSRTNSWFTTYSGQYARIFTSDANKASGTSVTMWTNNTAQALPAYCGVQEIYSSSNWVYIRDTGLGAHVMGPWYLTAAHTTLFPSFPVNSKTLYRIPRTPSVPATKTINALGSIGYFVDGVTMFNSWDGYYWNGSTETNGGGSGYWNRDAYVNEGATFDPANAHQPGSGQYHYHANPPALRYLLGDHVDYNAATKTYSESTNAPTKHSPILGWVADGYPIYGPYGYSSASNSLSGIRRMISGYVQRNGQYGTSNLTANGRATIPQWAVRIFNVSSNQAGPTVSASYPLGRYMEDNDYLGDHGYVQGPSTFDLDEYNGRWCVTPEFPGGTYAYFVSISSNGTPVFPFNIGRGYYGNPTGGAVSTISETVTTNFIGGTNSTLKMNSPSLVGGHVSLTWSAVEGGAYQVEATTNLTAWTVLSTNVSPIKTAGGYTNSGAGADGFYRVGLKSVAAFDSAGTTTFTTAASAPGGSAARGSTVTITITLTAPPSLPPANIVPASVTLAGTISGSNLSRPSQDTAQAMFSIPTNAVTGAQNIVVTFSPGPTYTLTGGFTIF